MLAEMDLAAASAGPWLVLGVVLGLLLAGASALAIPSVRRARGSSGAPPAGAELEPASEPTDGWTEDDLPGFLDRPPGVAPAGATAGRGPTAEDTPLAAPEPPRAIRRRIPEHAGSAAATAPDPGRLLLVLSGTALLLIGIAAALAVLGQRSPTATAEVGRSAGSSTSETASAPPARAVPDPPAVPEQPQPGGAGAGRLAAASVPIGEDGAFARLTFGGLVLERRAVGVTAAYPSVSLTAADVPGGPALAHIRLPLWNCLTDTAPDDPDAAGCRRLPTEYAELPTPALTLTEEGDGVRMSGRFPTYVRPSGSPPEWTGRVYPLTVRAAPDGDDATGTLHLGTERAQAARDPLLSDFRRGR
jgi:hypothetical protein